MHTYPFETPLGFHERYVVENKDRYLEGRYYFDEWDKGLRARGLVKQQRELYRQRPDYASGWAPSSGSCPRTPIPTFLWATWPPGGSRPNPKREGPLFLQIGFPGPHPPYDPIPRYAEPYMERDLPLPRVHRGRDGRPAAALSGHAPAQHRGRPRLDRLLAEPTPEQLHRQRAYYLANVTMIDEKIGQILQALEARGYLENAVVIFTSDHGDCLSDHGHSQKWTMYDIITRMPLIVWAPGTVHRRQGHRWAVPADGHRPGDPGTGRRVRCPRSMEAQSLLPALQGEPWDGREYVFAEHGRDGIAARDRVYDHGAQPRVEAGPLSWASPMASCSTWSTIPSEIHNLWDDPAQRRQEARAAGRAARVAHPQPVPHARLGAGLPLTCVVRYISSLGRLSGRVSRPKLMENTIRDRTLSAQREITLSTPLRYGMLHKACRTVLTHCVSKGRLRAGFRVRDPPKSPSTGSG